MCMYQCPCQVYLFQVKLKMCIHDTLRVFFRNTICAHVGMSKDLLRQQGQAHTLLVATGHVCLP